MKLFTSFLYMFSFLIPSSSMSMYYLRSAVDHVSKELQPREYAILPENASFVANVTRTLEDTPILTFISNEQLQNDVHSVLTRGRRANQALFDAIRAKDTATIVTVLNHNKGNINALILNLATRCLEEQKQTISATLQTPPTPAIKEDESNISQADHHLISDMFYTSRELITAIDKNDVNTITKHLAAKYDLLPPLLKKRATDYLNSVGQSIAPFLQHPEPTYQTQTANIAAIARVSASPNSVSLASGFVLVDSDPLTAATKEAAHAAEQPATQKSPRETTTAVVEPTQNTVSPVTTTDAQTQTTQGTPAKITAVAGNGKKGKK